jgi:small subunit ribosomal protein S4
MKRQHPKFEHPLKPWSRERIEREGKIMTDYGLRRKHEIWRAEAILRNFRQSARQLITKHEKGAESMLLGKMTKLGLVRPDATLDDALSLTLENILERRLQTIIWRKGIATTPLQSRQYIVHGHIAIDGQRMRWPGTLVPVEAEQKIKLYEKSKIRNAIDKPKGA